MLGYVRFLLALVVMLSHVDVRIFGLNPGVVAVVVFYMLAGVVVTHLWHHVIPGGEGKLLRFYRDRLLRIFPLYFYAALLTLLFLVVTAYGQPSYSPMALLNNVLVVPLNYYMYIDSTVMSTPAWNLIPQAWSLGAELQAYLLLPLVLVYPRVRMAIFVASFAVYIAANLTYLNADYYGYRLIPGVFFIFVIGSYLSESQTSKQKLMAPALLFSLVALVYALFDIFDRFPAAYARETLLGMLIGIPLISYGYLSSLKLPYNKFMGSLSYGVFLTHFLIIWLLDYVGFDRDYSVFYWVLLLVATVAVSLLGVVFVERPLRSVR